MNYLWVVFLTYFSGGMVRGCVVINLSYEVIRMYSTQAYPFTPTPVLISLLQTSVMAGSMVGSLSNTVLIRRFGRRKLLIIMAVLSLLVNAAAALPVHWMYMIVMRLITGFAAAIIMVMIPMIFSEYLAPAQRGIWSSLINLFVVVGTVLCNVVQYFINGHDKLYWVAFVCAVFFSACLIVVSVFVKQGAKPVASATQAPKANIFDKKYRKCLILAIAMGPTQAGSGINPLTAYASMTFKTAFDSPNSGTIAAILITGFNTVAALIGLPFVKKLKRRPLLMFGFITMSISHVGLLCTTLFVAQKSQFWFQLLLTFLFLLAFQFAQGPLFLVVASEVYPLAVKEQLMSLTMIMNWITIILVTMIYPLIPVWANYVLFLVILCGFNSVMFGKLPETSGKTLIDIEKEMIIEAKTTKIEEPAADLLV